MRVVRSRRMRAAVLSAIAAMLSLPGPSGFAHEPGATRRHPAADEAFKKDPELRTVWELLESRHGRATPINADGRSDDNRVADHRADHGGLDNVSVDALERLANPLAGVNPLAEVNRLTGTAARSRAASIQLAQAQVNAASGTPDQIGQWSNLIDLPLVPIFAALLPNGKVLMWDSVGDNPTESYATHNFTRAAVWDPATNTHVRVDVSSYNIFCAGFAHMADGRIFVAGGNKDAALNGIRQTHIFDHNTNSWSRGPDMAFERWYPSVAALANGEHFVMAGGPSTHEVRQLNNTMRSLTGAVIAHSREYPFIQTAPDGRVLYVGPQQAMRLIDTAGTGSVQGMGNRDSLYRSYGSYAMYDIGKVLVAGGGTSSATVVNMIGSSLSAAATTNMTYSRRQHNLTVLPNGQVLATGGLSSQAGLLDLNAPVFAAESWNPATGLWTELASAAITRQYHSFSLLLPDGRVLTGGGGICGVCFDQGYLRKDMEIFTPPYLFRRDGSGQLAARPTISTVPASVNYAQSFSVSTPDAAAISKVALVRLGAPTHGQDQGQRFVPLNFTVGSGQLNATSPANANIAPPGYYMLFLVNSEGVPSVSRMVQVSAPTQQQFASTAVARSSSKCMDVPGGSTSPGARLQQYSCNSTNSQLFDFVPVAGAANTYNIKNRANGLCVDISGASTATGAAVIQWNCHGGNNQRFTLAPQTAAGAKTFQVRAAHSNLCVGVSSTSTANGVQLTQRSCSTANTRLWTISGAP